jgi:DNA-binding XRE family transcriptional regulator
MTLKQFIKQAGGQVNAAKAIGVTYPTLWRWETGKTKPKGRLVRERLASLGVKL